MVVKMPVKRAELQVSDRVVYVELHICQDDYDQLNLTSFDSMKVKSEDGIMVAFKVAK